MEEINMECLIFEAENSGYNPGQVKNALTVKELKECLDKYDDNTKVYLSFDDGYTYGRLPKPHLEDWPDDD